jgi:hypothetical protein
MSETRKPPSTKAAMAGSVSHVFGRRDEEASSAASEENRIDALIKLKFLLDSGVLTQEQYESERARLTAGI